MKLFLGAAVIAATSLVAISAQAGEKLRYKMQSTWGSQVAINGEAAVYFSNKVKEVSGGNVRVRFHKPKRSGWFNKDTTRCYQHSMS